MNAIHPEYIRRYRVLRDDELLREKDHNCSTFGINHKSPMPRTRQTLSALTLGIIGLLILVSVIIGVYLGRTLKVEAERKTKNETSHIFMEDEAMKKRDAELDLIKRILFGIVDTMKEISPGRRVETTPPEESVFPRPITVVVKNAALRERPAVNSKSKAVLDKGTALLALDERENWLQVISPFGDEAWIRKDLVLFEDEK